MTLYFVKFVIHHIYIGIAPVDIFIFEKKDINYYIIVL